MTKAGMARPLANVGTGATQERVNQDVCQQGKKVLTECPVCGSPLRYGSFDPAEGYFYWCSSPECRHGPIGPYVQKLPNRVLAFPRGAYLFTCGCGKKFCIGADEMSRSGTDRVRDHVEVCDGKPGVLSRTMRDTPPNEAAIRGCQ